MKHPPIFSACIGDRASFAIEFSCVENPRQIWNEWWGYMWLWVAGQIVGQPDEFEMVKTGLDSLFESALGHETNFIFPQSAEEALDLVMQAVYGDDEHADDRLLSRHEVLPRTDPYFDGWEAILIPEGSQERFIFRRVEGPAKEFIWPIGTFRRVVLQAKDEFEQLGKLHVNRSSAIN